MENEEILDAIEERINALEEEVRRLRGINARLCVVLACLIALVVVSYLIVVGKELKLLRVLRVERLEFVWGDKVVASIRGERFLDYGIGDVLSIYDGDDKPVVRIGSINVAPPTGSRWFILYDREGEQGIVLKIDPGRGRGVDIINKKGHVVAELGAQEINDPFWDLDSGSLIIYSSDGNYEVASLGCSKLGGAFALWRNSHMGDTKRAAVSISVMPNGSGGIAATNRLGTPIWSTPLR